MAVVDHSEPPLIGQINWEEAVIWGDELTVTLARKRPHDDDFETNKGKRRRASVKDAFESRVKAREQSAPAVLDAVSEQQQQQQAAAAGQPQAPGADPEDDDKNRGTKERQDIEERLKVEAALEVPKEIASSMFPPVNGYVASGKFLDMVDWDTTGGAGAADPQFLSVIIDLNDEELLLDATIDRPVWMRRPNRLMQQTGRNRIPTWQLRQKEKAMEAAKRKRARDGLPPPTGEAGKDPFNISNDRFYTKDGKIKTTNIALKHSIGKSVVEHSLPSRRLDPMCFKYDWKDDDKATFHRVPLRRDKYSSKDRGDLKLWRPVLSTRCATVRNKGTE